MIRRQYMLKKQKCPSIMETYANTGVASMMNITLHGDANHHINFNFYA